MKHGHTGAGGRVSPTYLSWQRMKDRCTNPSHVSFKNYGAKGVTVCESWAASFEAFLRDMGERPEGASIDRIDSSLGYMPGNCRWATRTEQNRNRTCTVFVDFKGVRMPLGQAAELAGVKYATALKRARRGMPIDQRIQISDETRRRISQAKRCISDETRRRMSESAKARAARQEQQGAI